MARCTEKALGPDDVIRQCQLPAGHGGFHDPRHPSEVVPELAVAARLGSGRLGITAIQAPSGRWTLAGSVPINLAYVQTDGSPITAEQAAGIRQAGPGFVRGIRHVTFASEAEALEAVRLATSPDVGPSPPAKLPAFI